MCLEIFGVLHCRPKVGRDGGQSQAESLESPQSCEFHLYLPDFAFPLYCLRCLKLSRPHAAADERWSACSWTSMFLSSVLRSRIFLCAAEILSILICGPEVDSIIYIKQTSHKCSGWLARGWSWEAILNEVVTNGNNSKLQCIGQVNISWRLGQAN